MKIKQKTAPMLRAEKRIGEPIETFLREGYKEHSANFLGKKLGTSCLTVRRWLNAMGIQTRDRRESLSHRSKRPSKEELSRLYGEGLGNKVIARKYDVCEETVIAWYKFYGLERDYKKGWRGKQIEMLNQQGTRDITQKSKPEDLRMKVEGNGEEFLRREYEEKGKSAARIARELKTTPTTIINYLKRAGIVVRGRQEAIRLKYGTHHPEDLRKFLESEKDALHVASLAALTEDTSEIATILMKMWPDRFPSASQLARALPRLVEGVGHSLRPFTLENALSFYDSDYNIPREVKYDLDNLIYGILISEYQPIFERNPKGTLADIKQHIGKGKPISDLARRVLDYYREVYSFSIPGHGKLRRTE